MNMPSNDPYHSRGGTTDELASRVDPVLWTSGGPAGPLGREQLERFEERGFLVLPELLGADEVSELLAASHALAHALDPAANEDLITEPDSAAIRSIFRVHERAPRFAALAADERLAGAARQILGSAVYVHQSRINFKPGFDGRDFQWHSDFETWHIEDGMPRMRALSASVMLTENTAVNGPLMLIPGSHRTYVRCVGATPERHYEQSLKTQRYGVPGPESLRELVASGGITQALGPPGTVVLFDCNTMHGSSGNLSPFPRHNVFLVYNSVENALTAPFGGRPPRPDFLGARRVQTLPAS
jgi:ectoine hydroxylase